MKNKQIFFIVLFLIFTCINGLKLKKNIKKDENQGINNKKQVELNQLSKNLDGMIEEAKKEMSSLIKVNIIIKTIKKICIYFIYI